MVSIDYAMPYICFSQKILIWNLVSSRKRQKRKRAIDIKAITTVLSKGIIFKKVLSRF